MSKTNYYVYRFLDKSKNVIYVGKSKQELQRRFNNHLHLPNECYAMVHKIEFIVCSTESDMSIKEIYYINKYKTDEHYFFNLLDTTELPKSVNFSDKWKMYRGSLPSLFSHSINYKKGYVAQREIKYNEDGTIKKYKANKEKGISSFVDGFNRKEVDLIIDYLIAELNCAENDNQEQTRFRNLVMFVLGINLPLKPSEFLSLKYRDLFDEKDRPKAYTLQLGRYHQDEIIDIPLRTNVKELISAYRKEYNLSYANNAEEPLFLSREHRTLAIASWGHILGVASEAVNIKKNIGSESLRKTYGLNIYKNSKNKNKALLFLGEMWGQVREAKIIKYLGLTDNNVDFDYYFGETFALGNVDLSRIKCIQKKNISNNFINKVKSPSIKTHEIVDTNGLRYVLKDDTNSYSVEKGTCTNKIIKIKKTHQKKLITTINKYAFYRCDSLVNVIIGEAVESIGDCAFMNCKALTSVTIPRSVKSIGYGAFWECSSLECINYLGTMNEWDAISKGTYWHYKTDLYSIYCADGTISK